MISWGYDTEGVPFSAVYETPADAGLVAPCFDITSWSDKGPSQATLSAIYSGISNLHNDALTTMLQHVVKLTQNGGRNGELYPSCNSTCQANGTCPTNPIRETRNAILTSSVHS